MDIRSHPAWQHRSILLLWFQQYQHAKNTDPVFERKKNKKKKQQLCLNPVKSAVCSLAAECEANCHSLLTQGIFFFPCRQPHCSISVPIPSDTACLLNHTLGPVRVCPHQTLSVFTSSQGDISVTTCFTLASQLFPSPTPLQRRRCRPLPLAFSCSTPIHAQGALFFVLFLVVYII